ncbi:MAG: cupin domain-containing protein [Candidatus Thorarchaeota archaeon]
MYLTKDVPPEDYEEYVKEGAKGFWHKSLLSPENSTTSFALRTYIIDSGGHSAPDNHKHEHGVYLLSGILQVKVGEQLVELNQGDVIYIASHEPHQFLNPGAQPAKFLCVRNFPDSTF